MLVNGLKLDNSMTVAIEDLTRNYFGDYYHVKLVITVSIPLAAVSGLAADEIAAAERIVGDTAVYAKNLERMAVCSADLSGIKDELLADFARHSLPYLQVAGFPPKLVRSILSDPKRPRK